MNISGTLFDLKKPKIMAILNHTPDSFYEKSRLHSDKLLETAQQMLTDGATMLDIGGYSTRPNADAISLEEECDRVLPIIEILHKNLPQAILSIDTFRAKVAKKAIEAGGHIINDISGGNLDPLMFETIAHLKVPYILMHSRGTPKTMQNLCQYTHVVADVLGELQAKLAQLRALGVKDVVIDVGFGFAKTMEQNYELLHHLEVFSMLDCPILAGLSRKSMIWKKLQISPNEALNGTTALNTIALMKGASILRVHDVKPAMEVIQLLSPALDKPF